MKFYRLLILLLTTIFLNSCEKDQVWVKYFETQCANPWPVHYTLPDSEKVEAIKAYFSGEGVEVFLVTMEDMYEPAACMACMCHTGKVISCRVREKDLPVMLEYGFTAE
jgi:hypothetical protein